MNTNSSSRSGLFLMELIISILFFSLAGAVCVRLFVGSHMISKNSVELNHSLEWCQNIAEAFYGCNGKTKEITGLFTNCISNTSADTEADEFFLLFDQAFHPIDVSVPTPESSSIECSYILSVRISEKRRMLLCEIKAIKASEVPNTFSEGSSPIYELEVTLYPKKEDSYEE